MELRPVDDEGPGPETRWPVDVAAAAILTLAIVLLSRHLTPTVDERAVDGWAVALMVAASVPLALARLRPRAAFSVVAAVLVAYVAAGYPNGPIFVCGWIALFVLSWRTSRRDAVVGAAALCVLLPVAALVRGGGVSLLPVVFVGWSAAAVLLGDAVRHRRDELVALRARAEHLERTREEEARRRVAEERLRIARDLHDSVAHSMATINVQAAAAAHVVDRRPEAAREALVAIRKTSGDVLDELAVLLRLLRDDDEIAGRAPTPGLDDIEALVAASREAHLPVSLTMEGPTSTVTGAVGTAAYRIVQESLTNALRHARPTQVDVRVTASGADALEVEVADDGGRAEVEVEVEAGVDDPDRPAGLGIRGMRERAEATGGHLDAHARPGGGFLVSATWSGPR